MLRLTRDQIKALWDEVVEAVAERDSYLREHPIRPKMGPPASETELRNLEKHLGLRLPPSYRQFLSLYNGVRDFTHRTPLLSTQEIIEGDNDWEVVEELDPELCKFVFAGSHESDDFFCFDWRNIHEDGEMEVVVFNIDGEESRYSGFTDFLQEYLSATREAIKNEQADRSKLKD